MADPLLIARHGSTECVLLPRPGQPARPLYCQRGEAENRIKEARLDLFGTRTSCNRFLPNWLQILFSALAYTSVQALQRLGLQGTELAKAISAMIRTRLLKIGACVIRNTRRIRLLYASHHPLRDVFAHAVRALSP
jgi:hypothetical protein